MHEADDVIERAVVNRNARALRDGNHFHDVFERRIRRQGVNIRARNHDFAHLNVAEVHRALNKTLLDGLEDAALARLLDENSQLLGGTHGPVALRHFYAEGLDEPARDAVEKPDGPAKRPQKPTERASNEESDALGMGQAQAFRDELSENDLQRGQQNEREEKRETVIDDRSVTSGDADEKWTEEIGESELAEIAKREACQSDSDLYAGNDRAHVGDQKLDDARAHVTLLNELANARMPNRDERKFDGGKKCVNGDEGENDE